VGISKGNLRRLLMTTTTTDTQRTATGTNAAQGQPGRVVSIVGIVLGALGLLFGFILGVPGLICGIVGAVKGNRLGWWAIGVSIVCTVAGFAIGLAIIGGHR
jgi:hypothetical protein